MKKILLLIALGIATQLSGQNSKNFHWPGSYKAAVILSYDDGLDCHLDVAVPALDAHGFKGTFFCTGSSQSLQNRMDEWRAIAARGHELGNHSLFHPCNGTKGDWVKPEYDLRNYTLAQIRNELYTANTLLKAVDGNTERTYGYTCSDYMAGEESFRDVVKELFVAARNDGPIPNSMDEVDLNFVPSWGVNDPTGRELIDYVKEAEKKGTIAVFMFHSVGGGYLNVSAEAHQELLDYLEKNKKTLWTDTFMHVMKYVRNQR